MTDQTFATLVLIVDAILGLWLILWRLRELGYLEVGENRKDEGPPSAKAALHLDTMLDRGQSYTERQNDAEP